MEATSENARFFRDVLGHCSTAVTVITAPADAAGFPGMTVGSFLSVSLDPPLVAFLPAKSSGTWPRIERTGRFCANILAHDQIDHCTAFFSRDATDRFAGIDFRLSITGAPILTDCLAWTDCAIEAVHEAGDHWMVIGRVTDLAVERSGDPLLFYQGRYRELSPHPEDR